MTNKTPAPEPEDVEGHRVHGGFSTEVDVEGHMRHIVDPGHETDEVEGHARHMGLPTDDDVEGHIRARGASDSLDDPFGPLKR